MIVIPVLEAHPVRNRRTLPKKEICSTMTLGLVGTKSTSWTGTAHPTRLMFYSASLFVCLFDTIRGPSGDHFVGVWDALGAENFGKTLENISPRQSKRLFKIDSDRLFHE